MKVAYYSPMPPSTSGIADYSALLVPELAKLIELEVVSGPGEPASGGEVALYQVGNSAEHHDWIIDALHRRPGLVVLHEATLHHLVAGMTIVRGDRNGYLDAMQRDAGVVGRLVAHGIIDGVLPPLWETRAPDFPLTSAVLDHASGVIVHSHTVESAVRRSGFAGPVHRVPHPAWPRPETQSDAALEHVRGPVIGAFGHLNRTKRAEQLLDAFALLLGRAPDATLILVGAEDEDLGLNQRIAEIERAHPDAIVRLPYVEEQRLWNLIGACDVCVCLRYPTMGETSGVAIRALTCGRPLVVSDVGWFAELPDMVAVKVAADDCEVEHLEQAMGDLIGDPSRRAAMSAAALEFVDRDMGVRAVAERYRRAIVACAGGAAVAASFAVDVAHAEVDAGVPRGSAAEAHIHRRAGELWR